MTLTVPVSKADPGRAARPDLSPPPDGAQAVADFGQVMLRVGTAIENDRLDREMQRHRIDLMRDMNALRLEVREIDDPDAADRAWSEGVASLRSGFDRPGENGRPRLDPKNRERFGLVFDDLKFRHAGSLGLRTLEMRATAHVRNLDELGEVLSESWIDGDPDMRLAAEGDFFDAVDEQIAGGLLTAQAGETAKDAWLARTQDAAARLEEDDDARPVFAAAEPTAADDIARRIEEDESAGDLARIFGYAPATPRDVERMQAQLERLDAVPEEDRPAYLRDLAGREGQRRRGRLARPAFAAEPIEKPADLRLAAARLAFAWQAGRIDRAAFVRETALIRAFEATFDV